MRAWGSVVAIVWLGSALCAEEPHAPETAQQIEAAIADLGAEEFSVREAASVRLWRAGRKALPAIEAARRSSDAEVAFRAETLWERFRDEIGPDVPDEVKSLVREFRAGDAPRQKAALDRIQELGRWDVAVLLLDSDERLVAMLAGRGQAREYAVGLAAGAVRADLPAVARRVLQVAAERDLYPSAFRDRVSLAVIEGTLDERIASLQAIEPEKRTIHQARELAWSLRVAGRYAEAKATLPDDEVELLGDLSIVTDDWRDAVRFAPSAKRFETDDPAVATALAWLAGDSKRADAQAALAQAGADRKDARAAGVAEAFLACERWDDALTTMRRRLKPSFGSLDKAVALERGRMRPGEALRLIGANAGQDGRYDDEWLVRPRRLVEGSPSSDRPSIALQIEAIFTLYDIGETETADRWLDRVLSASKPTVPAPPIVVRLLAAGLDRAAVAVAQSRFDHPSFRSSFWTALSAGSSTRPGAIEWAWLNDDDARDELLRAEALAALVAQFRERPQSFALAAPLDVNLLSEFSADARAALARDACRTTLEFGSLDVARKLLEQTRAIVEGGLARGNDSLHTDWKRSMLELEGDIALKAKDYDAAAAAYERASATDPNRSGPIELIALALELAGRTKEAQSRRVLAAVVSLGEQDGTDAPWEELERRAAICPAAQAAADRVREFVARTESWNLLERASAVRPVSAVTAHIANGDAADLLTPAETLRRARLASFLALPHESTFAPPDPIKSAARLAFLRQAAAAKISLAARDYDLAAQCAATAVEVDPSDVAGIARLVADFERAGRSEQADAIFASGLETCERVCREFPRATRHRRLAAALCVDCGRRLDLALARIEQAVGLHAASRDPEADAARRTHVATLLALKRMAEAQTIVDAALAKSPANERWLELARRCAAAR